MDKRLGFIARKNGLERAMAKLAEECSEYAAAQVKYSLGEGNRNKCLEEMADVLVVMEQVKFLLGEEEMSQVQKMMRAKISRQVERMQNEKFNASCTGCMGAANGDCDGCEVQGQGVEVGNTG